jgi:hypothetical protein
MDATGSVGVMRTMEKIKTDTTNKTGIICNTRFNKNLLTETPHFPATLPSHSILPSNGD